MGLIYGTDYTTWFEYFCWCENSTPDQMIQTKAFNTRYSIWLKELKRLFCEESGYEAVKYNGYWTWDDVLEANKAEPEFRRWMEKRIDKDTSEWQTLNNLKPHS